MYDQIDLGKIQKSGFDLSCNVKGTGRIGRIIPTRCQEVLPGDRMKGSSAAAVQFEPLAVPMLANMYVRQEHFYVPNRIVWQNWDKFFTGGEKLDFTTPPPSFTLKSAVSALFGYLVPFLNVHNGKTALLARTAGGSSSQVVEYALQVTGTYTSPSLWNLIKLALGNSNTAIAGLQVDDLCQSYFETLRNYQTSLADRNFTNDLMSVFARTDDYDMTAQQLEFVGYSTALGYAISKSPDPFERVLAKKIEDMQQGTSAGYPYIYPLTDDGREMVHVLYDCYRQFIGVSSNLDYFSYPRMSLSDFYFLVYSSMIVSLSLDQDSPYIKLDVEDLMAGNYSALALRANYVIWYNYYRDQLLELQAPEPATGDTVTSAEMFQLLLPRQRCWSKDTFTTALTTTGTGNVVVPVNNKTSSDKTGISYLTKNQLLDGRDIDAASAKFINADVCTIETSNGDKIEIPTRFISGLSREVKGTQLDSSVSYFSLDMLDACRRAQKWLQKALIYGNRPQDRLYTSWGVRSLDARLSLPECLATSSQMVQLSVNTNNTTIQAPTGETMSVAGDKSANAYGYDKGGDFNRFCEEHGLIISYLTILPEATYPYSVKRGHSRMDKFDYPTPEFATLGMDAVYDSELVSVTVNTGVVSGVFGYQGRYFDAKCNQDEEHGTLQTTENMYTFGRQWSPYNQDTMPKLNYAFVHCFPKLDMFVVEDVTSDYFRYDIHHALAAERALPVCGMYL